MNPHATALLIALITMPTLAAAQEAAGGAQPLAAPDRQEDAQRPEKDFSGFVAVGAGLAPKYEGSKTYGVIPFAAADLRYRGVTLEVRGLDIRADLGGDSGFEFGPALGLDVGRQKGDSATARLLNKIPFEADVGGFVGYRVGGDSRGQGQLSLEVTALADITGVSNGFKITPEMSYAVLRGPKWLVSLDASTTYADRKNLRTYFGVTPAEALASGLAAYAPGAGFRNVGAGAFVGYQFNQRWGVIGRVGYDYYLGDTARSPIVRNGARNQLLTGLALSYRF